MYDMRTLFPGSEESGLALPVHVHHAGSYDDVVLKIGQSYLVYQVQYII